MMKRSFFVVALTALPCLAAALPAMAVAPSSRLGKGLDEATAAAPLPGLDVRFAEPAGDEVPDFQRHVVPLLSRLGCNGRACHGSFQGRGGFQLSLFGYDFAADHAALLEEQAGRVDPADPEESLILAKPTDADMHEGGQRMELGSWQYNVLRSWIAADARFDRQQPAKLQTLEVTPQQILFDNQGQQQPLRVVAHWSDGQREDVTAICRFTTNDDTIAAIDEEGLVTAGTSGDTHVVAYYDKAVVPIPVIRPVSPSTAANYPQIAAATEVDTLVIDKLSQLGVLPSEICSDADFLRRVSLDMTGTLPAGERAEQFLADTSPDKRERLVEELLASREYASWWATRFSDWTGNSEAQLNNVLPARNVASKLWFAWLQKRIAENVPYDQLVEGIVTAESRDPDESYREYCESMSEACRPGGAEVFSEREGLPLYWARRNFRTTEERAIGFAYAFMGIRIQCAQCHKHPFDQWSKQDFEEFAQLFAPIQANNNAVRPGDRDEQKKILASLKIDDDLKGGPLRREISQQLNQGNTVPFGELIVRMAPVRNRRQGQTRNNNVPTGKLLGVDQEIALNSDPRDDLMQWLRDPENPYFSKALVNRVWANYFGIGLVNPTDDLSEANPPSNAPLFDYLAEGFIDSGFDMKWLHRQIVLSDTYQRSWQPNETNAADKTNFSHFIPRRLPAEVVHDSILFATASDDEAANIRDTFTGRAIADALPVDGRQRGQSNFALSVFGQSIRETNCDCDRSDDASLLQSVYLRNDAEIHARLSSRNGWVHEACRELGAAPPTAQNKPGNDATERQRQSIQRQIAQRRAQAKKLESITNSNQRERLETRLREELQRLRRRLAVLEGKPSEETDTASPGEPALNAQQQAELESVVRSAYLRTLTRQPETQEVKTSLAFIREAPHVAEGVEGLLWSLINTKEFILNH